MNARLLLGPSRSRRIFVAECDGEVIGIAALHRRHLDRWGAYTVLFDPAAAEPLARVVDRSHAREINGFEGDVAPLQRYLTRARKLDVLAWRAVDRMPLIPEHAALDPRSRIATVADVPRLARLYAEYPFIDAPTMLQLRHMLRRDIRAGLPIAILEVDSQVVAAMRMESRGCRFARWTDTFVHPAHRGRGYMRALAPRQAEAIERSGLGRISEAAPAMKSQPLMEKYIVPEASTEERGVCEVLHLNTPRRFPGQGRLRRALYRLGGRRTLPPRGDAGSR